MNRSRVSRHLHQQMACYLPSLDDRDMVALRRTGDPQLDRSGALCSSSAYAWPVAKWSWEMITLLIQFGNPYTWPCIQTGSRLPGTVWRGLIFFTTDRPDYHRMPPPAGDNHGRVVFAVHTGFALGHRASTFRACAHLITTAVRYQLRAQGRFSSPEPNMFGGDAGRSPGERPHDVIAGESPARRDFPR